MKPTELYLARLAAALVAAGKPDDFYLHAALGRAVEKLPGHAWTVPESGIIAFPSESRMNVVYMCDGNHCECPTRKPHICWHMGVWLVCSVLAAALGLEHDRQGQLVLAFPNEPKEEQTV